MIFVLGATRARGARALRATPAGADAPRGGAEARAELVRALEAEIEPERYTTATPGGSARIVALVEALERSGAPPRFPADLGKVDGSWDLCFTTNAISLDQSVLGSLAALPAAARLPSPLVEGSPLRSRRVRQEIDVGNNRVRNCVTITAWPEGAAPPLLPPFFKELLGGLEGSEVELTLDHLATVEAALSAAAAQYMPARLRIELQQVRRVLEPGPAASPGLGAGLLGLVPKEVRSRAPQSASI